MRTLKVLIILALLTTVSGCRALSEALEPDNNAPRQDLPVVKRDQPNLSSEKAKINVDPDSDALIEVTETELDSVVSNSNAASATNENSSVATETNTNSNNVIAEQSDEPATSNNVVTFNSFGKVKAGMTISQASQALGTELVRGAGFEDSCYYVEPKQGLKGVRFMVTGGKIARIDIESDIYATDKGAKVGDTEAKIKSLYPRVQVQPNKYDEKKHDLEIYSEDEKYLIIFETDGNRVTGFRVGNAEEVGYVEGCS